ncbi:hypothetical protein F1728_19465 [Gimesia benthica]|uniref:Uncharacterized protein n=1 Tax=Gimesia benthica TaxID=2608982 RepID=A0A6I6AGP6_9PLAN|nr:hypothetical protein [Gimesia benthica]QGQ24732.1 hypothetical protein F1728_19465 [Gimesia benthica]
MNHKSKLIESAELNELAKLIQRQFEQDCPELSMKISNLQSELKQLERLRQGWQQSLGNPDLPLETRSALEQDIADTMKQILEIETRISELESASSKTQEALDPEAIAERLDHLASLLEGDHASAMNVALSQHIEGIYCDDTGKVVVRMCRLGALANPDEMIHLLARPDVGISDSQDTGTEAIRDRGRRRTRRNLGDHFEDDDVADFANDFAVDPRRYSQLGDEWFTEDVFHIPDRPLCWSAAHAREVAEYRLNNHASMEVTADYFETTVPTIRKALNYAKEHYGIDALGKSISKPSRRCWAKDHAIQVAQFFRRPGASVKKAEAVFGKSQPTLAKAKRLAVEIEKSKETTSSSD